MPKPEEKPNAPTRPPGRGFARHGRVVSKPARKEKVRVGKDFKRGGGGVPLPLFCAPEVGDPAEDGSECIAAHDVFEELDCHDVADLSPDGRKVRLLVVRFPDGGGVMCLPEGVESGFPFRFRIDGTKLYVLPSPVVPYELEVVCEGDTLPAPPEPALPEEE